MTNLITRLKELEARIYAADAHEAPKYVAQLQDALYGAWPKLSQRIEALEAVVERAQALVRSEHSPMLTEVRLGRRQFAKLVSALADLEGDTDEPD